jgi:hypothetical protein
MAGRRAVNCFPVKPLYRPRSVGPLSGSVFRIVLKREPQSSQEGKWKMDNEPHRQIWAFTRAPSPYRRRDAFLHSPTTSFRGRQKALSHPSCIPSRVLVSTHLPALRSGLVRISEDLESAGIPLLLPAHDDDDANDDDEDGRGISPFVAIIRPPIPRCIRPRHSHGGSEDDVDDLAEDDDQG